VAHDVRIVWTLEPFLLWPDRDRIGESQITDVMGQKEAHAGRAESPSEPIGGVDAGGGRSSRKIDLTFGSRARCRAAAVSRGEALHDFASKVGQFEREKKWERLRREHANGAQYDDHSATHQRWRYRLARAFGFRVRSAGSW
jgi:hypothetical protein